MHTDLFGHPIPPPPPASAPFKRPQPGPQPVASAVAECLEDAGLVNAIAAAGLTRGAALRALDAIKHVMRRELLRPGGVVSIRGFGKFDHFRCQPRSVCHPRTGATVPVRRHGRIRFRPGTELRAVLEIPGSGPEPAIALARQASDPGFCIEESP